MNTYALDIPLALTNPAWSETVRNRDTAAGQTAWDEGTGAELAFEALALARGWGTSRRANAEENMMQHTDLFLGDPPAADEPLFKATKRAAWATELAVDVKSQKWASQMFGAERVDAVWVELHGAKPASPGWLYTKKGPDAFAFERPGGEFAIVPRIALQRCVAEHVKDTETLDQQDATLKRYARGKAQVGGRCDVCTLVPMAVLEPYIDQVWRAMAT